MNFALKRWWWLPLVTALLLLLAMGYVGRSVQPKAAAQLLLVSNGATDQQTIARANASALAQIQASNAFDVAATQTGASAADLRQRTRIGMSGDASVVQVEVTAPTADAAAQQANAVAKAAVAASATRLRTELDALTAATTRLIETPLLKSETAERSRTDALAARLATSQGDLVASSGQLSLLQEADPDAASRAPVTSLALVGGVAGLLLGLLLIYQFLRRRGRIRTEREALGLYPQLDTVRPADVPRLVDESVDAIILVDAGQTGRADRDAVIDSAEREIRGALAADGILVTAPVGGMRGGSGAVTLQATTPADAVRRLTENALVLWPVRVGHTTVQDLDPVLDRALRHGRGRSALLLLGQGAPVRPPARDRAHAEV